MLGRSRHSRARQAAWLLLGALQGAAGTAHARQDLPPQGATSGAPNPAGLQAPLPTITIETDRQRAALGRELGRFVAAITVAPQDQSIARWGSPICPLVAGLPRDQAEFVLRRLTEIIMAASAPIGPRDCKPNLFVLLSADPERLLRKWWTRDPLLFDTTNGVAQVDKFLANPAAIRVWYNIATAGGSDHAPLTPNTLPGGGPGGGGASQNYYPTYKIHDPTRLIWQVVRGFQSVIVAIDTRRLAAPKIGPLTDYVGMVALAEISPGADLGEAPTILHYPSGPPERTPPGLTAWDRAFLQSLYETPQESTMQLSQIKSSVVKALAR